MRKVIKVFGIIFLFIIFNHTSHAQTMEKIPYISSFPIGNPLPEKFSKYFIGQAYIAPLTTNKDLNVPIFNVTFEPGCRNNWHSHTGGQILVVVGGKGYYQEKGKPARLLQAGDVVEIAPNVIHWHGAAPDSWFSHLAIECNPQTNKNTWLEPVDDKQYAEAVKQTSIPAKFENAVLSKRYQHIALISAFTAKGDQIKLNLAIRNALNDGMSINEIKEVIVQLYAYCGFPRCLNGLNTLKTVVDDRKSKGIEDAAGIQPKKELPENALQIGTAVQTELAGRVVEGGVFDFAPIINTYLRSHLFGDIFSRDNLSYQDREIATVSALSSMNDVGSQLFAHMNIAKNVGISTDQLDNLVTVIGKYVGKEEGKNASIAFAKLLKSEK